MYFMHMLCIVSSMFSVVVESVVNKARKRKYGKSCHAVIALRVLCHPLFPLQFKVQSGVLNGFRPPEKQSHRQYGVIADAALRRWYVVIRPPILHLL